MGAENADFQVAPSNYGTVHFEGRPATAPRMASAVIQAMNEARRKPREISVEELVPDNVRQYYGDLWRSEHENLVAEEARWASLWWWQKVRETLWPKR